MYRLSAVIEEIFGKYLAFAEMRGITFDLDFPDTTKRISEPSRIKESLEKHLSFAIKRGKNQVRVVVRKDGIEIFDDGAVLSPSDLKLIKKAGLVEAKSRLGFGTVVFLKF